MSKGRALWLALSGLVAATAGFDGTLLATQPTPELRSALVRGTGGAISVDAAAMEGHGDLAFVSLGALYVLAGGRLRLVVGQNGAASAPVYSPNGRFLAYDFDAGKVGITLANGTDQHVVETISSDGDLTVPKWLPGGDLLVGTQRYAITSAAAPVRVKDAPLGLEGFSPSGDRFVFVVDTTKPAPGTSPAGTSNFTGTERIEVASSLFGPRTIWHSTPIRLDQYGLHGDFVTRRRSARSCGNLDLDRPRPRG